MRVRPARGRVRRPHRRNQGGQVGRDRRILPHLRWFRLQTGELIQGQSVTAPALVVPLAPADAAGVVAEDAVEPLPAPAVFSVIVPPSLVPLVEQPARANEPASTPTTSTLATRRRPRSQGRERAIRWHLRNHAENTPVQQDPDPTHEITTKSRPRGKPSTRLRVVYEDSVEVCGCRPGPVRPARPGPPTRAWRR